MVVNSDNFCRCIDVLIFTSAAVTHRWYQDIEIILFFVNSDSVTSYIGEFQYSTASDILIFSYPSICYEN